MIPLFCIVPDEENGQGDYAIDVYNGYRIQIRKGYSKGVLHSVTVFDEDGFVAGYFPMDTGESDLNAVNGYLYDIWSERYAKIEN